MSRVSVSVPATTANLGAGYDAFGLALGLSNTFTAELAQEWTVEVIGEGADHFRTDGSNAVARAMARVFDAAGVPGRTAHIVSENRIPTGRGLGSSAAVIVGGLLLGNALVERPLTEPELFALATEIEGHPDNIAAAFYGGFTISADAGSDAIVYPVPISAGLATVVAVSKSPLQTKLARKALPQLVPHEDAAFNAGRASMFVAGIASGRVDLIAAGLHDRIHEQYRAHLIDGFDAVVAAFMSAGTDGAVLSGAGPTVIGLVTAVDDDAAFARASEVAYAAAPAVAAAGGHLAPIALRVERERPRVTRV